MLEIELYKEQQRKKYRGVPLRDTAVRRVWDTPNGRDPAMPDPIEKENPFSFMADRARAISVQRKIDEMIETLTANGVSIESAEQQAKLLLNGLSQDVLKTVKERADLKTVDEKKSAAVDEIVTNITAINTHIAGMTPEAIARSISAQEASRSVLSGSVDDFVSGVTVPRRPLGGMDDVDRAEMESAREFDMSVNKFGPSGREMNEKQAKAMWGLVATGVVKQAEKSGKPLNHFVVNAQASSAEYHAIRKRITDLGLGIEYGGK